MRRDISKNLTGIGNGSKARLCVQLTPYYMASNNYGVSLRLIAVQLIDLVEFGSTSADACGFDNVDGGYTADAASSADTDDAKATVPGDEGEGDF